MPRTTISSQWHHGHHPPHQHPPTAPRLSSRSELPTTVRLVPTSASMASHSCARPATASPSTVPFTSTDTATFSHTTHCTARPSHSARARASWRRSSDISATSAASIAD
ncbi:hypothetical protein CLOM_g3802 [Closterium sp. NIES-68]|nr:hypothetical protein CLOM_g3802 [Closterium sp. NIES-68]